MRARAAALLLLAACGGPPPAPAPGWPPAIVDGRTTRDAVVAALGPPTASYEGGRITGYRILLDGPAGAGFAEMTVARPGALPSAVTRDAEYRLILVFDGEVVRRHSLVRRGP